MLKKNKKRCKAFVKWSRKNGLYPTNLEPKLAVDPQTQIEIFNWIRYSSKENFIWKIRNSEFLEKLRLKKLIEEKK